MGRNFANRADQVEYMRRLIGGNGGGSVIVTGQPGIGRTTFLEHAVKFADPIRDEVIMHVPLAIRKSCPQSMPDSGAVQDAEETMARSEPGRRVIIAVDDAHLMDYSSLMAFKRLVRRRHALLIATRPAISSRLNSADPTGCLAYEPDTQVITLLPLSTGEVAEALAESAGAPVSQPVAEVVHTATGGNPALLKSLISTIDVAALSMSWTDPIPAAEKASASASGNEYPGSKQLICTTRAAWRECAFDQAQLLCRLALQCGVRDEIADIWAAMLLLQGRPDECGAVIDDHGKSDPDAPHLTMLQALAITFGTGRVNDADVFLRMAADRDGPSLLHAFRAWLLAIGGCADSTRRVIADSVRSDHATALFIHAASAVVAETQGRHAESVFHLRRAIASAETASDDFPWIRPYLQASLIGSLTLCGRAEEATSTAQRFHARECFSGWNAAVSLQSMMSQVVPQTNAFLGIADEPDWCFCCRARSAKAKQSKCPRYHTRVCGNAYTQSAHSLGTTES